MSRTPYYVSKPRDAAILEFLETSGPTMRSKITHAFIRHGTRNGLGWNATVVGNTLERLERAGKIRHTMTSPRNGKPGQLWRLA